MTLKSNQLKSHRGAARLYGIFFLLAFISYGMGSGIVASFTDAPAGLGGIHAGKPMFITGILLMAVVHSVVNIGLAVVIFPILKPFNPTVAYGYLALAVTATLVAVMGALSLILLVPLSDAFVVAGPDAAMLETLATVLTNGGFYGYQLSMTLWGLGGLLFCYVLGVSRLVPHLFPIWGTLGYLIFISGTLAEMFGYSIGLMLSAPGGLFEVSLSLWLIFRGFSNAPSQSKNHLTGGHYANAAL